MIIHDTEQGSPEWMQLRSGIPTSSQFELIITPTGKISNSQERYLYQLIAERIIGGPIQDNISLWQQRGKDLEAECASTYEFIRDVQTEKVGFITDDNQRYGTSPDRLVNDDGLVEIKIPKEWQHVAFLLKDGAIVKDHRIQAMGQLWITDRQWVDLVSYNRVMPLAIIRVERDEKFIKILADEVKRFSNQLEALWTQIVDGGLITRKDARPALSTQDELIRAMKESLIATK